MLYLTRQLAGYPVSATTETGSKQVRAMPVAAQTEAGNVTLVRAASNWPLLEELADFPHGNKDDQVERYESLYRAGEVSAPAPARVTNSG